MKEDMEEMRKKLLRWNRNRFEQQHMRKHESKAELGVSLGSYFMMGGLVCVGAHEESVV